MTLVFDAAFVLAGLAETRFRTLVLRKVLLRMRSPGKLSVAHICLTDQHQMRGENPFLPGLLPSLHARSPSFPSSPLSFPLSSLPPSRLLFTIFLPSSPSLYPFAPSPSSLALPLFPLPFTSCFHIHALTAPDLGAGAQHHHRAGGDRIADGGDKHLCLLSHLENHSYWYCWGYWQVIRQNHSTSTPNDRH